MCAYVRVHALERTLVLMCACLHMCASACACVRVGPVCAYSRVHDYPHWRMCACTWPNACTHVFACVHVGVFVRKCALSFACAHVISPGNARSRREMHRLAGQCTFSPGNAPSRREMHRDLVSSLSRLRT